MHKDRSFLLWFRYGTALLTAAVLLTGITEHAYGRETGRLKVAFVGDPQVDDSTELLYARKSVYRELRERKDIDMAIFLGDIVNDSMELLEQSRESMDSLAYPYFVYRAPTSTTKTKARRPRSDSLTGTGIWTAIQMSSELPTPRSQGTGYGLSL